MLKTEPSPAVYFVQSPSHDGEKTTASLNSTPIVSLSPTGSPCHYSGHGHSPESSISHCTGPEKSGPMPESRKADSDVVLTNWEFDLNHLMEDEEGLCEGDEDSKYQKPEIKMQVKEFYKKRNQEENVRVVVTGDKIPMYGSGAILVSPAGMTDLPVTLKLELKVGSRAHVMGKLVNQRFLNKVEYFLDFATTKIGVPISLRNCTYHRS
ncbi:hypothetical protein AAHA92_25085 [Salvia divinorum]|uniref:Uncharacterized protein n=1 Tax=Salvia divinorum TaxID=28513 RepID=A0ABD1GA64_SALDI